MTGRIAERRRLWYPYRGDRSLCPGDSLYWLPGATTRCFVFLDTQCCPNPFPGLLARYGYEDDNGPVTEKPVSVPMKTYILVNPHNGSPFYVGDTSCPLSRIREHAYSTRWRALLGGLPPVMFMAHDTSCEGAVIAHIESVGPRLMNHDRSVERKAARVIHPDAIGREHTAQFLRTLASLPWAETVSSPSWADDPRQHESHWRPWHGR